MRAFNSSWLMGAVSTLEHEHRRMFGGWHSSSYDDVNTETVLTKPES